MGAKPDFQTISCSVRSFMMRLETSTPRTSRVSRLLLICNESEESSGFLAIHLLPRDPISPRHGQTRAKCVFHPVPKSKIRMLNSKLTLTLLSD